VLRFRLLLPLARTSRSLGQLDLVHKATPTPCLVFPLPPSLAYSQHFIRIICDAFTRSQATSASACSTSPALKTASTVSPQMRLLCLKHTDTLFRGLKQTIARSR
jgi:hypothetical protein